jgi:hypothetical protein
VPDFIAGRGQVVDALRRELVGPDPRGKPIDCAGDLRFGDQESAAGPFYQAASGEEILQFDRPVKRYGIAVLYPPDTPADVDVSDLAVPAPSTHSGDDQIEAAQPADDQADEVVTPAASEEIEQILERSDRIAEPEADDFDLGSANAYRPSSMAVTFSAELPAGAELVIKGSAGRYLRRSVPIGARQATWWLRSSIEFHASMTSAELNVSRARLLTPHKVTMVGVEGLDLHCEVFARPAANGSRLLTVCLINRSRVKGPFDEHCVFQAAFQVSISAPDSRAHILPYPSRPFERLDSEERSLELLFRDVQTFAVGHGCAADWEAERGASVAAAVSAKSLPSFQIPSITPEVLRDDDGSLLEIPMSKLAGLIEGDDGLSLVEELISGYRRWIARQRERIRGLPEKLKATAETHLVECTSSADRMTAGLALVRNDQKVRLAFQLANRAVLDQQLRTRREPRQATFDAKADRVVFEEAATIPDPLHPEPGKGYWRPFQVAFLMATLGSISNPNSPDRNVIDLIWFPTGGGKTEAYLALAAFAMFHRRLSNPANVGVEVLMRYTLRLLTAQQFTRACALVCAMEHIRLQGRRERSFDLGEQEFSIGIWLGGSTTPNRRDEARATLRQLQKGERDAENKFLLVKCPWCSAQMGPLRAKRSAADSRKHAPRVIGYTEEAGSVVLSCPDHTCDFAAHLPVYVIDEDIYEVRPTIVIGTVDKFAMLAWRPAARALFGIGPSGKRDASPPGLIIQDELHLISGPLGSMVGLYEGVIQELCSVRSGNVIIGPKLVASTATIRRFREQALGLYGRDDVELFPPRGIDAADSYFAHYATDKDGVLAPGTLFVGIHAPGLGSLQTAQVRTFAALMQAATEFSRNEADPWWTLLMFFNSLRELGNSLSLFQSDIRDYLTVLRRRYGIRFAKVRQLRRILELTGRLRSGEVPEAIAALEVSTTSQSYAIDACLASNIIEVGIDIDRLSLLSVVGQPKTTAQYIQVTGRVGRRWWERPGLVTTIYSASKPRDRSHFEKFRSYHERLYASVEPTSVTPFAPAVLDRALHAVIATYVRQLGNEAAAERPYPVPEALVAEVGSLLLHRVNAVDPEEADNYERMLSKRLGEWRRWQRTRWQGRPQEDDIPLLREAGSYASARRSRLSWATPQSMRNVDAECEAEITNLYLMESPVV